MSEKRSEDDWKADAEKILSAKREEIDKLDRDLVEILSKRAGLAKEIGDIKKGRGRPAKDSRREAEIYREIGEYNKQVGGVLPPKALEAVYREIISACRALQEEARVAYLGPEGTYSHMAALRRFGSSAEFEPVGRILDVFDRVERETCGYGVVPVMNSIEGAVNVTLDSLVERNVGVCGEIYQPVSHCLMRKSAGMGMIRRLYTHYQPLGQCRAFIERKLPRVEVKQTDSTSQAARAAAGDPESAAIASALAAEIYGLEIVERAIEDHPHNTTRFLVIGRERVPPTGRDKTSILFSIKDRPGILYRMLQPFAEAGINLSKIESRPIRNRAWEYIFFIDLLGHVDAPEIARAIGDLEEHCVFVKNLGSYPAEEF